MTSLVISKNDTGESHLLTQDPTGYVRFALKVEKTAPIIDADARQIAVVCPTAQAPVIIAQEIPSESNARELGILDFLHALERVELCQSADAAKIMVERALLTGYMTLSVGEVVRAIEMRLPVATPSQVDELSLIRSKLTGDVKICLVLGAFGDRVLVLTHGPEDRGIPRTVLNIGAMPETDDSAPSWDVTRPTERRVWYISTDGVSAQSQEAA
jgi:hypothetical protein